MPVGCKKKVNTKFGFTVFSTTKQVESTCDVVVLMLTKVCSVQQTGIYGYGRPTVNQNLQSPNVCQQVMIRDLKSNFAFF